MTSATTSQTFLFLMGSLSDATILDAAIEAQHLEFQKLGVLTYLGRLEGSPDEFCSRLQDNNGVYCDIHWMKLPSAEDRSQEPQAPVVEETEEAYASSAPAFFMVNN